MAQTRSQFQAPQFNARAPRRAPAAVPQPAPVNVDPAANAHGDEAQAMRIPTRNVKLNIAILSAMLDSPLMKMSRRERHETILRLQAYRAELRRRGDIAKSLQARQAAPSQRKQGKQPAQKAKLH